jgi:uncharacterized membrane protein
MMRALRHLFASQLVTRRRFSREVAEAIELAIASAEQRTSGEIRFAVETDLELWALRAGKSPRERALDVFGELRVWDSELGNGVLIYVLMADRDVEIVADRGAAACIRPEDWEAACKTMEEHFRAGRFKEGALAGVTAVGALLARHFPARAVERNEQPDQPSLL